MATKPEKPRSLLAALVVVVPANLVSIIGGVLRLAFLTLRNAVSKAANYAAFAVGAIVGVVEVSQNIGHLNSQYSGIEGLFTEHCNAAFLNIQLCRVYTWLPLILLYFRP